MRCTEMDLPYLNFVLSECFDETKPDGTPESLRYRGGMLVMDPTIWVMQPEKGVICIAKPLNTSTYEAHVASLPGTNPIRATRECIKWLFENNKDIKKLTAFVPSYRRDVKMFCIATGYKVEGLLTKSFKRNGELLDQTIYGLSREDVCHQ
jgi:hypothetical protein